MTGRIVLVAAILLAAAAVASGCGGSSAPKKPAYCSDVSALKKSVKNFNVTGGGLSGLQTQVQTIRNQANAVVSSAKSDFPTETSALKSSISGLTTAIKQLSGSASAGDFAALIPMATSVKDAVTGFTNAVSSKC
jgi:phage-related protein